jgi:hypothetical protein
MFVPSLSWQNDHFYIRMALLIPIRKLKRKKGQPFSYLVQQHVVQQDRLAGLHHQLDAIGLRGKLQQLLRRERRLVR